ncbi:MAG: hypothetical protein ACREBR_04460 [bacterium]
MSLKNKKRLSPKFPCRCGHPRNFHQYVGVPIGDEWCEGVIFRDRGPTGACSCECYVPDNLKYLEQCSKKKGKGKKS